MKLGLLLRYHGETGGPNMELVLEAEKLGFTRPTRWVHACPELATGSDVQRA